VYTWQITAGPGQFKDGRKRDGGESVIYFPPENLSVGEHRVSILTAINDEFGKGDDGENTGRIEMKIKRRADDPEHYYIDFRITRFRVPPTPPEPPVPDCPCRIAIEWLEGAEITHSMIEPEGTEVLCPNCTDTWIAQGTDTDDLLVVCDDDLPACGDDRRLLRHIPDAVIHNWFALHGMYLGGNTGSKVLYKSPPQAPPGPLPNEKITLRTQDSRTQYTDDEPEKIEEWINLIEVDLVAHKPKVIDPAESAISEEDEETKGVQTFVNLDNDDRDTLYDTATTDVEIADEDEMVKLKLRLKPKELDRGIVRLRAVRGAGDIMVWREPNKRDPYMLGTGLRVPRDFQVQGDYLETTLYVEGITAHTQQRQTKLRMTYDGAECGEDEVTITILGIDKIEWEGKNNSLNHDNTLTDDPNHRGPGNAALNPTAVRVFPGARLVGGAIEARPRNKVDVKATLTVEPIEPVKIYFDSFDVDDPTSRFAPVDDETNERDNRGLPVSGAFEGEVGGVREQEFDAKEETMEFKVTMQPGDNFRIVGNGDKDFLADLENKESTLGAAQDNKLRIINKNIVGSPQQKEIREATHYASKILTVWRFLHIEVDSMGTVEGNEVSGEIVRMDPADSSTATKVYVNRVLDDGSRDLSLSATWKGRFEKGTLTVAGTRIIRNLDGNGFNFFQKNSGLDITPLNFSAIDNDSFWNSTMSGTITKITRSGGAWVFTLNPNESSVDWSDFDGGTITIAEGDAMRIVGVSSTDNTVEVNSFVIPFTAVDDDTVSGDVRAPVTNGIAPVYAKAYIVPLFDTGKDNSDSPFHVNTEVAELEAHVNAGKQAPKSLERCWIVTITGIYQTYRGGIPVPTWSYGGDNDPDKEGTHRAAAMRRVHGLVYSMESVRDWIATPAALDGGNATDPASAGRQTREQEILNHEIGHLFGLDHPDGHRSMPREPNGGVMNASCCPPDDPTPGVDTRGATHFTETSLDKIRRRRHPGN